MSYLDTYFSRVNHLGETTAERIRSGGIRSFWKWLAESPHTVRNLSVERGLYFDGIILTSKDKEYQKIMFLNVSNNVPLQVGDIMNWTLDDGSIEKWILFSEEKKTNGTYRTFSIVRCNYLLKWIDSNGHLQSSWSYTVSSVDSKIKGNYRTWNNLITPQPNKYAEILMPRRKIDRATNFIIEEESWQVIEYDHTSVPGTIYLSLTENKINLIYDKDGIADTDKRAHYELLTAPVTQVFTINQPIEPIFTITKNGYPIQEPRIEYISSDPKVAAVQDGVLTAMGEGEATLQIKLLDCDDIEPDELYIDIKVSSGSTEFSCYIDGPDKLRLDRSSTYTLVSSTGDTVNNVVFSVSNLLASVQALEQSDSCLVHANADNELGEVILTASIPTAGLEEDQWPKFTKTITIIPLW